MMSIYRPTGWHGESGTTMAGGHIIVDFYLSNNKHIMTHHVYPMDNAYHGGYSILYLLVISILMFSSVMQDLGTKDIEHDFSCFHPYLSYVRNFPGAL
jgi:hypothetical protein